MVLVGMKFSSQRHKNSFCSSMTLPQNKLERFALASFTGTMSFHGILVHGTLIHGVSLHGMHLIHACSLNLFVHGMIHS